MPDASKNLSSWQDAPATYQHLDIIAVAVSEPRGHRAGKSTNAPANEFREAMCDAHRCTKAFEQEWQKKQCIGAAARRHILANQRISEEEILDHIFSMGLL